MNATDVSKDSPQETNLAMKEIFVYAGIGGIGLVVIIFIVYLSCCKQRKEVKKVQFKGSKKNVGQTLVTNERESKIQKRSNLDCETTKPTIAIQQLLDSNVTPSREEYNHLKDLEHSQNAGKLSASIGMQYILAAESLNRDPDVLPYDHNIVKLKSPIRDCRYINASKISPPYVRSRLGTLSRSSLARSKIPSTTSFIISQGPLPNTCVHHLQMILEQKIDVVVMLTKLEEPAHEGSMNMDQKCARYWPHANEVEEFERFYIRNLSESNVQTDQGKTVDDLILRWLELRCGGSGAEHNINQFQYLGWSEFEAPTTMSSIFLLIKEIRKIVESKGKDINILVHCSTGTGRSGTFVALYYLMELFDQKMSNIQQAQENQGNKKLKDHDLEIDVFNSVSNLMKERCEMIQSFEQYKFLHDCLSNYAKIVKKMLE